jgi:aldose 1-epimerase
MTAADPQSRTADDRTPNPSGEPFHLAAGPAELTVHPGDGGRIGSFRLHGLELLRTTGDGPFDHGSFPMVPWAGRTRDGLFTNGGSEHRLPVNDPPHALHGTGTLRPWYRTGPNSVGFRLAEPWPYPGIVSQEFELTEDQLSVTVMIEALEESFPAQIGWHPWFLRQLTTPDGGDTAGEPVRLDFTPEWQEERGEDHLPTGSRIPRVRGPWDDCFGMPGGAEAVLTWPGALRLEVTSRDCEYLVVYDKPEDALCVEPQTGPPNGLNTAPRLVTPIEPLRATMVWKWTRLP